MNEERISIIERMLRRVADEGGNMERTRIYPNAEVIEASPAGLSSEYVIVEDDKGFYSPAVKVAGLTVSNGDLVNLLFIKGTEPIAFQHGSGSPSSGATLTTKGDILTYDTDLTRLPVGSDGQVLTADSAQAEGIKWAAATAAGEPQNILCNGDFAIVQRGTTATAFTSTTTPANNDDTYLLDRWLLLSDGNDIVDVTQWPSGPSGAEHYAILDVETANKQFAFLQPLEAADSIPLRGKSVSIFLQARTVSGSVLSNIRVGLLKWTGTADSITSDVVATWAGAGTNPTLATNWAYINTPSNLALVADTWTIYKIENIAIDTTPNNLAVLIWLDDTDASIGDLLHLATVGLYVGETAPDEYIANPVADELARAQWYFERQQAAAAFSFFGVGMVQNATTGLFSFLFGWKRVAPTISISAAGDFRVEAPTATYTCSALSFDQIAKFSARGVATISGGTAAPALLEANNTTDAYVDVDAEL